MSKRSDGPVELRGGGGAAPDAPIAFGLTIALQMRHRWFEMSFFAPHPGHLIFVAIFTPS
jgi:hypothetical protein